MTNAALKPPAPGEKCALCGKRKGRTASQRQMDYVRRKKANKAPEPAP